MKRLFSFFTLFVFLFGISSNVIVGTNVYGYSNQTYNPTEPSNTSDNYVVNFPDTFLKAELNRLIALKTNTSRTATQNITFGEIKNSGIKDFTGDYSLSGKRITFVEGMQFFTNLERLDISKNSIVNFSPLQDNTSLTYLNVADNPFSDASFLGKMVELKELNLKNTQNNGLVSDLSILSKLIKLQKLDISGLVKLNSIESLGNLSDLKILTAINSNISDISSILSLINLEDLKLSSNKIKNISGFEKLSKIRVLHLNHQILSADEKINLLPISNLPLLNELNLNALNLEETDVKILKDLPSLTVIMLAGNRIKDLNIMLNEDFSKLLYNSTFSDQKISLNTKVSIFKNPIKNIDGKVIPIVEKDNIKNSDVDGNLDPNGEYIKLIGISGKGVEKIKWNKNFSRSGFQSSRPFSGEITLNYNIDLTAPVFSKIETISNNSNNLYAKEGNIVTISLFVNPADTWKQGNNIDFKIGDGDLKNSGNFTKSEDAPVESRNRTYTVKNGDNGKFSFQNITFFDAFDNKITSFTDLYTPVVANSVIVDTVLPEISFIDGISPEYTKKDLITVRVDDINPDETTYKYGFSSDNICDNTDIYTESFLSGKEFFINSELNNGKYICFKAEDKAGNVSYKISDNKLKIDESSPIIKSFNIDITKGINNPVIDFSGDDKLSGLKEWKIKIDGGEEIILPGDQTKFEPQGLSGTTHTVEITLVDKADNISEKRKIVFPPIVKIISEKTADNKDIKKVKVEIIGPEGMKIKSVELSGINSPTLTCPNQPSETNKVEVPFTCELGNITESGTLEVIAISEDNFRGSSEQKYIIDREKPNLKILSTGLIDNGNGKYLTNLGSVNLVFDVNDNGGASGPILTECLVNGNWINCTSPYEFILNGGENILKVRAKDSLDNVSEEKSIIIERDMTSPVVNFENLKNVSKENVGNYNLSGVCTYGDNGVEIKVGDLLKNVSCNESGKFNTFLDLNDLPDTKELIFSVKQSDKAGNISNPFEVRVKKDTLSPIILLEDIKVSNGLNGSGEKITKISDLEYVYSIKLGNGVLFNSFLGKVLDERFDSERNISDVNNISVNPNLDSKNGEFNILKIGTFKFSFNENDSVGNKAKEVVFTIKILENDKLNLQKEIDFVKEKLTLNSVLDNENKKNLSDYLKKAEEIFKNKNSTVKEIDDSIKKLKELTSKLNYSFSPSAGSLIIKEDKRVNKGIKEKVEEEKEKGIKEELNKEEIKEETNTINKEKIVNGEIKRYSLSNRYLGCPMIPNIVGDYNKDFKLRFRDIIEVKNIDELQRLTKTEVINPGGVNNTGLFEGKRGLTRAEFLAIVLKVHCYDVSKKAEKKKYKDVDLESWQSRVIEVSDRIGITRGYGDGSFRPNAEISKIEAFGIMMKMADIKIKDNYIDRYKDKKAAWQTIPLSSGEYLGILKPEETNYMFNPNGKLSRDEMVKLIVDIVRLY